MVRNLISVFLLQSKIDTESLRYRPPVDFITKLCTETFECTSNNPDFKPLSVTLKPDDVVALPYSMLGKDSKYFENPDQFIPERMLNKESFQKNAFYPFGDGPRACIGMQTFSTSYIHFLTNAFI